VDDNQVINDVLNGRTDQYALLMERYHNEMFSFVFRMVGQYQDTEDLVQEIFYKVYRKLNKYDDKKASFRTWLYRIASNHTINHLNSKRYKSHVDGEVDTSLLASDDDVEAKTVKDDQLDRIVAAMKKVLIPKHQKIVALHYFSGLSVQEISETLEIPDKTIYKALKTSIEKIKEEVTSHGETAS
jgi:RNA polymerase sigma-70 factor (ECF subfamily)